MFKNLFGRLFAQSTFVLFISIIYFFSAFLVSAYEIDQIQIDPSRQDFVVGPGKTDLTMEPGETKILEVIVSNRTGIDREFEIKFEDFIGSQDLTSAVVFTSEQSATTLKDYLSVPELKFFLRNGERARVPVTISIPEGSEPGGRYASILVSTLTPLDKTLTDEGTKGGIPLITQSGTLVFVTIPGEIKKEGRLIDFFVTGRKKIFSDPANIFFSLVFENTGRIHLRPYGTIMIKNLLGQEVKKIELTPWFAMPDAKRLREVGLVDNTEEWSFMFGRYTAQAEILRDYGNLSDTQTLAFWVLPWKLLLTIILILFVIIFSITWLIKYFKSHFEFKNKSNGNGSNPTVAQTGQTSDVNTTASSPSSQP